MSNNKLNLLVQFTGVDKMSGSMKNIVAGTKKGSASMRSMNAEARRLDKEMKQVNREILAGSGDVVQLVSRHRQLEAQLARTNRQIEHQKAIVAKAAKWESMGNSVAGFGRNLTLGVTLPLAAMGATAIKAGRDNLRSYAQVKSALASMGPAAGKSYEDIEKLSKGLMNNSLYAQADILKYVSANMLTFGNISGTVFDDAQQAAVDLSARLGQDLQSSTVMVGKALNDPVKGVTALSRVGVSFTEGQKEMIKSLSKTGKVSEAQKIILDELSKQYGGAAKAAKDADPGGAAAQSFGELQGVIGERLLPKITPLLIGLTNLMDRFGNLSPAVQNTALAGAGFLMALGPMLTVGGNVMKVYGGVIGTFKTLSPVMSMGGKAFMFLGQSAMRAGALMMANPMILAIVAVGVAIGVLAYLVYSNWDKITSAWNAGVARVKQIFNSLPAWMKSIGVMMMKGLLMSLNPALLVSRLLSVAKGGVTAFKNYFGIKSPSRLFMEMGTHINDGLGIGLERGKGAPVRAVGKMAGAVAGAGALALSPAAASARSAGPVTVNITVHQLPGEDTQALAQRVAQLVEQAQKQKRLRSYEDDY